MSLLYAIFLGLLQGATEFLPISSSGHLVLAEYFLKIEEAGLPFDVALHIGTLTGILIYFHGDFQLMAKSLLKPGSRDEESLFYRRLTGYLCLGTVPAVLAGLFWGKAAETYLRSPAAVALSLAAAGLLLLLAERMGRRARGLKSITIIDVILIGLSQALAIVPGVSRSGITMSAGLCLGLDRTAVTRFSFLLSAPVMLGAAVYNLPKIFQQGGAGGQAVFYLAGFLAAAASGYLFIAFLLRFVRSRSLEIFAYYRFLLALIVVLALIFQD